jgi:ribosomal protein L11 methyltransferase
VDVDEVAVQAARENFERNGLAGRIETGVGSAAQAGGRQWQLVVANILAHILIDLLPNLAAALAPDGTLILSGLIVDQEPEVAAAAEAQGLRLVDRRVTEDWVALVAQL